MRESGVKRWDIIYNIAPYYGIAAFLKFLKKNFFINLAISEKKYIHIFTKYF